MSRTKKKQRKLDPTRNGVSSISYFLYVLFICSFFLHLSERIPGIAIIRPDLLIILMTAFSLLSQQNKLKGRLSDPCSRALTKLVIFFVLSLPFVKWPGSVITENMPQFIKALVFFYFTVLIIDTEKRLKHIVYIFMACQLFRILEPLYLNITDGYLGGLGAYIGDGEFAGRLNGAPSDGVNPNGLALVIASLFPFLHYLWGTSNLRWKLGYYCLIPPLLYTLILTLSRSGFIALSVVVWQILINSKSRVFIILIIIAISAGAWLNMSDLQKARYLSLSSSSSTNSTDTEFKGTARGRIDAWFSELHTFLHKPIVGHGIGTSSEAAFHTRGTAVLSHNLYTEVLVEMGFIGFVFFMLFIKSIYNSLKVNMRLIIEEEEKNKRDENPDPLIFFYKNLLSALNASFWMYIIFSFAQYGVREFNWYFLGGMTSLLTLHIKGYFITLSALEEKTDVISQP